MTEITHKNVFANIKCYVVMMIVCDVGVMDSEGSDSEGGEVWEDEEAEKKRNDGFTLTKT